ncbi:S9 family peptidase [Duganella sp. Root336D2]|uniref:alpha/beta hydrolase family protein n=1 Tax=Duganella sp. Root336D2 TaxID=1736518 RepID=UPI000A513305|nr:alpha/beta fold hydrolase [Duganella sp. Root336D2]
MRSAPRLLMACLAGLALAIASPAGGAATGVATAAPPAKDFFNRPLFGGAVISPSGKYLAARIAQAGGRTQLAVIDLASRSAKVVANFKDADVVSVQWVNDQRLVFESFNLGSVASGGKFAASMFAIDRDGGRPLLLASDAPNKQLSGAASPYLMLASRITLIDYDGERDSDLVYAIEPRQDGPKENAYANLWRVNTIDGSHERLKGPAQATGWVLDRHGEPRLATTFEQGKTVFHLLGNDKQWRKLSSVAQQIGPGYTIAPLGFGEGNTLYVTSNGGADKSAVYRYDMAGNTLDAAPLLALDGYDFKGRLVIRNGKLLGVQYQRDGEGVQWFDPALQQMQDAIDKLLTGTVNVVQLPQEETAPYVLVRSYSDVQPERYYSYERATGKLARVGESHPEIKPGQMGMQEEVRYAARDGLEIPAMLTLPAGKRKNLPMVVLVHGGPWVRGSAWGWRADVQFLASRGYAVLQPEFRGSTGFGRKHYLLGWKQWGLKMQDDVADGMKWAVAQGIADPARVCIAGASYGGYATLMGLVKDHDLYQCGIEWVGVTDIDLLFSPAWSYPDDISADHKRYTMPDTIGDPVKDAAQFKATSPLAQAHRIKRPLLLAYGGKDQRVPIVHGTRLRDAVRDSNPDVEWIEYPNEGHGWYEPRNNIDFWTRVERFLDRHIGAGR